MKDSIILELAKRWEDDAKEPEIKDVSASAQLANAEQHGRRQGHRECADALRMLVDLLGDKS